MNEDHLERKLAAILHADVVGYSRLSGADEDRTHRTLNDYVDQISKLVGEYQGRIINRAGDAVLVEFSSVTDAIECSLQIQQQLTEQNNNLNDESRIQFRIGINLGDVITDRGELYGDGVNVAARLQALAEPGGICISGSAHDAIGRKLPVKFENLGKKMLKNIEQPVRAYRVSIEPGKLLASPVRRQKRKSLAWATWLLIVLILGVFLFLYQSHWKKKTTDPNPDLAAVDQVKVKLESPGGIAVLPFSNMSGDEEQTYFADGMTEDLITDLSKISGLEVIARTSSFQYKNVSADIRDIARELNVRYVLEGSVRRSGDTVRINAQLIDADNGNHLWAERYDGAIKDIFKLQDEIAERIVIALAITLSPSETRSLSYLPTESAQAYENFLQGRAHFFGLSQKGNRDAREFYEKAIALDPGFASAYAMLAWSYVFEYLNGWSSAPDNSLHLAISNSDRAIELNPDLPVAYFAQGLAYREKGDWSKSLSLLEKAIKLDPNYANAYVLLSSLLYYAGRPEEGLKMIEKAMKLEPFHPYNYPFHLGQAYFILKRYDDAIETFSNALEKNPDAERVQVWLAASLAYAGQVDDAEWEVEQVLIRNPDFSLERFLKAFPFKHKADLDHLVDGLVRAGFKR